MTSNVLLHNWGTAMWPACWQGGLIVLAVWSICRLMPSMPARLQCWFWRLVVLKFLAVLLLPTVVDLPLLPARSVAVQEARVPVSMEMPANPVRNVQDVQEKSHPAKPLELPSLQAVLCVAWMIGVGWSLARLLTAWYESQRLRKRSPSIASGPIVDELRIQSLVFGLKTSPRLLESPGGGSPMLIGVFRPVILIPAETLARLTAAEQTLVLGHELAHIRRNDLIWGLATSLVRALFFFHPLVWLSERQLKLAQEVAADELVVAKQNHDPIGYGKLLLSVIAKLGSELKPRPTVSVISLETAGPVHSLTRRLVAMTRFGRTSRRVVVSSGILLTTVVLLGLVPWRLVAAESKEGEKPSSPTYRANVRIAEHQKGQPEQNLSAPTLLYHAGQWAFASCPCHDDKSRLLIVTVSTSPEGQPAEHTIQVLAIRNPSGSELTKEENDRLFKVVSKHMADIDRNQTTRDLPKNLWFTLTGSIVDGKPTLDGQMSVQCDGNGKFALERLAQDDDCFAWKSPKVMFASGATGKVILTRNDGSQLAINVTVSPATSPNSATTKPQAGDKPVSDGTDGYIDPPFPSADPASAPPTNADRQPLHEVANDKLTLADYEAVPNPKNREFGKKPYRMDSISYGLVISEDAKWETHVAGVNKSTGEWKWLEMPKTDHILFEPIMGDSVVAFLQHGEPLSQLAVYNGRLNKWATFPLQDRVIDVIPCVSDRMVAYQLRDRVVAYTAAKDVWAMLPTEATPWVDDDRIFVDTPNGRYEFTEETGVWLAAKSPTAKPSVKPASEATLKAKNVSIIASGEVEMHFPEDQTVVRASKITLTFGPDGKARAKLGPGDKIDITGKLITWRDERNGTTWRGEGVRVPISSSDATKDADSNDGRADPSTTLE